ncbi:transmembrane protein 70, mitochondrial [Polymixia lowei]
METAIKIQEEEEEDDEEEEEADLIDISYLARNFYAFVSVTNKMIMSPLNILRRLRPCIISQSISNIQITATRSGKTCYPAGCRLNHAGRRSFLNLTNKVQSSRPSVCLWSRCLSTSPSDQSKLGNLIYTGNIGKAVLGVKMFSYTSSGMSLCLMPHILLKTGLAAQSWAVQASFCTVIGIFTFLTPVLLHLLTKGYVVRLYHDADADTYTAVTYSALLVPKKTVFHQKQVRIPAVNRMFTTFYAGKTGLLVNPDLFQLPSDYNHLMGYDQPFSFDMDDLEKPDKS